MGIVINQSIKNSINFYIGMFFGVISTVFVYPNVFNNESDHWGLVQLIVSYSFIISTFSNLGVPKTFIRFSRIIQNKSKLYFYSFLFIFSGYFLVYFIVDTIALNLNPYLTIILKSIMSLIIFVPIILYAKLSLELHSIYQNIKKKLWLL